MMLDLKKLFPDTKFHTAEELKAKEDSFSIGDRVKVADNIRCRQKGKTGTIVRIEPEDKHGWKSFIVRFDDEKYGAIGFQSGDIDKINEKETTMKKLNENTKDITKKCWGDVEILAYNIKWADSSDDLPDSVRLKVTYHGDIDNDMERFEYGDAIDNVLEKEFKCRPVDYRWEVQDFGNKRRSYQMENTKVTLTVGQLMKLVRESYGHEDYGTRDLSDAVTDEEKVKIQGITDKAIEEMKNVFEKYIRNLKVNAYRAADNASAQWFFSEVYQTVKKVTKLSSGVGSTDKLEKIVDEIKSLAADAGVKLI